MPRILHVRSVQELRDAGALWDDLWWRSELTIPSARAELVALWVESFLPRARFHALVVEDQGRWVAALPLIESRVGGILGVGSALSNPWSPSGELLLDPEADVDAALDVLVNSMQQLPWQLLWLSEMVVDTSRWIAVFAALDRAGVPFLCLKQHEVGYLAIDHDWEGYRNRWSKNHRKKMSRSARRLGEQGTVKIQILSRFTPDEVTRWLRRGFEVEHSSWKGTAGTSALASPGIFEFYLRQAQLLAEMDQLELAFLHVDGIPIAFEYALKAKGVYHALKVGYDPRFSAYSPGHLLLHDAVNNFYCDPDRSGYDFVGPMTEAHAKWLPSTYTVGRVVIAPHGPLGRLALGAYRYAWPLVRHVRNGRGVSGEVAGCLERDGAPGRGQRPIAGASDRVRS